MWSQRCSLNGAASRARACVRMRAMIVYANMSSLLIYSIDVAVLVSIRICGTSPNAHTFYPFGIVSVGCEQAERTATMLMNLKFYRLFPFVRLFSVVERCSSQIAPTKMKCFIECTNITIVVTKDTDCVARNKQLNGRSSLNSDSECCQEFRTLKLLSVSPPVASHSNMPCSVNFLWLCVSVRSIFVNIRWHVRWVTSIVAVWPNLLI